MIRYFLILTLLSCLKANPLSISNLIFTNDPDEHRSTLELITSKGYPAEAYDVQTKDGYILTMHRIPHGRTKLRNKGAVLVLHGLVSSSVVYVINFAKNSLGFILADAGYDVWMGNFRGNRCSQRHVRLSPEKAEFWNFSTDEMAEYDLPAMIDFVLSQTSQKQLYYVGHSMGGGTAFAMLSEKRGYNKKIKLFIALAPAVYLGQVKTILRFVGKNIDLVQLPFRLLGIHEFSRGGVLDEFVYKAACDTPVKLLCVEALSLILGPEGEHLNKTRLGVYAAHYPDETSANTLVGYGQAAKYKKFQKYDYGRQGNLKHYKQVTPPQYKISRVTTPVALLWSENDHVVVPSGIKKLGREIKSLVMSYRVKDPKFSHIDFAIALNAVDVVYKKVLELLAEY